MLGSIFSKKWVSPLTGVLFIVVAVTGVCMFFHIGPRSWRGLHEWVALGLTVVGAIHILINLKVVWSYLKSPAGIAALVVGIVLCLATWLYLPAQGGRGGPGGRGPAQDGARR